MKEHTHKRSTSPYLEDGRTEGIIRKDGMYCSERKYHLKICQDVQAECLSTSGTESESSNLFSQW